MGDASDFAVVHKAALRRVVVARRRSRREKLGERGRAGDGAATHLGRHLLLLGLDVSKLASRAVSLGVELLPLTSCGAGARVDDRGETKC